LGGDGESKFLVVPLPLGEGAGGGGACPPYFVWRRQAGGLLGNTNYIVNLTPALSYIGEGDFNYVIATPT